MNDFALRRPESELFHASLRCGSTPGRPHTLGLQLSLYEEMEASFQSHGGIVGSETVTELLRRHTNQPVAMLARWIVDREVLSLEWASRMMLPLFQFDRSSAMPRPPVRKAIRELASVLDDWALALWFSRPNALLDGVAPVDAIDSDAQSVLDAARAERFLLRG